MKNYILFIVLFISAIGFSQKLDKIIEKDKASNLEKLIDKKANINQAIQVYVGDSLKEVSPLVHAVNHGSIEIIKVLIKNKSLVSNYKEEISKAFVLSISHGQEEISELLYQENPDLNQKCNHCYFATALMVAASSGNEYWYKKLKPKSNLTLVTDSNMNLLHYAASSPSKYISNDVLKIKNIDINLNSNSETTPIGMAAMNVEQPKLFDKMIELGADPKKQTDLGYLAVIGSNPDAYNYAVKHNFNINLWVKYDEWDGYVLEEMLTPHEDESEDFFFTEEQVELTKTIFNQLLDSIPSDIEDGFWDELTDPYNFNNLIYMQDVVENDEAVELYFKLIGKMQESRTFQLLPKKIYKNSCKYFGREKTEELIAKFDVQK